MLKAETGNDVGKYLLQHARRPPPIARARQHGCKLALDQLFDERPHPMAHRALDRIETNCRKDVRPWRPQAGNRVVQMLSLIMAWSAARRFNAKRCEVHHPGDTRWPKLAFGQNLNELAIDQDAKHGVHQFLYGHGQAETAKKIAVVSTYPANALSPALSKLVKVELSRRDWKSTHAAEKL